MTKKNISLTLLSIFCLVIISFVSASVANAQAQGNVPSWAVGTFYGQSPNGEPIMLTINRNGSVTAYQNGITTYGTIYKKKLNIGGATARIRRSNNGISAFRTDNGLRIDYSRSNTGWNLDGGDGQQGNVPNWAVGTFYGRNPSNGGGIQLTINNNGRVVANSDGRTLYGTLSGNRLTIDGATTYITRLNNGFSAVRNDNGLRIDYSRNNGGGWNSSDGQQGNVPNWAVGTFYGRSPNGETITLTIDNGGRVTAYQNGLTTYGTIYGNTISIGGGTARISRSNNGFSAVRGDNGLRINYSRR